MGRVVAFVYGVISYTIFFVVFLYAIGFVGNLVVPKSIDSGAQGPLTEALLINVALLGLFAIQHSVMARPWFKKRWTTIVPESVERSTYVLLSSLLLALLFWQWRPLPGEVWSVEQPTVELGLWVLFWLGWGLVLLSTFVIDHFDLFGLRQVWSNLTGKPYRPPAFQVPALYKYVRHPLLLGFVIAFWAAPTMTTGRLVFAVVTTLYMLVAIQFEEHDLLEFFGQDYADYRRRVPMLIPLMRRRRSTGPPESGTSSGAPEPPIM
jgi:methanethiol S-methyltransferase